MRISPIVCFIFLLFAVSSQAQFNPDFVKHLSENNYRREHASYLFQQTENSASDSSGYYWSKYYLQYQEDSLFFEQWKKSDHLFRKDTSAYNLASISMLDRPGNAQQQWFAWPHDELVSDGVHSCSEIYRIGLNPFLPSAIILPHDEKMTQTLDDLKKYHHRSAFKAGLLSAVVPGLGKFYAGRPKSGFLTMTGCALFGLQAFETYRKLGITHPMTIINLSVFGIFYSASIYGSAQDVRKTKIEKRNQYYKYAARFYRHYYRCQLYR